MTVKSSTRRTPRGETVMLVYEQATMTDVTGPLELLAAAPLAAPRSRVGPAQPVVVSAHGGPVRTWPAGITIHTRPLTAVARRRIDTLLVAGGVGADAACADAHLVDWVRETARRARRVVSICTGAFVLAAAGLLDGRRATTHWASTRTLAERFPRVTVDPDSIFVQDGNVYTSAGITAGMDLALHLVEEDYGAARALELARYWLLYVKRPGGQSQFSALLPDASPESARIAGLQEWIRVHLSDELTVARLAERVAMSPRHFARTFKAETGMTPARYVEMARVEAARLSLEAGARSLESVARDCGMGHPERLRRSFLRQLGVNPKAYRQRFAQPAP